MAIRTTYLAGGALAALIGGLALYGTGSSLGNLGHPKPCATSAQTVARVAPLARGEVAALDTAGAPRPAPPLRFKGPDGADLDLSAFKGKALLVNLWARWCGPCKAEMPALDRLQDSLGGDGFQVLAINIETRNLDKLPSWLAENWIDHLKPYTDPAGRVLPVVQTHTGAAGLPTTLLIDGSGCEIGLMKGPAEWSSEDAKRLIRAVLGTVP